jgi:Tfp pilus tip-associated adhesin PilY1
MSRELRRRSAFHPLTPVALLVAFGTLLSVAAQPARGDDRQLLRESSGEPYLFILLDTSGSMQERPEDAVNAFLGADDAESKMFQAKEALYEVMSEFDDIFFGFATFNQDDLRAERKHFVYRPLANPTWSGTLGYPVVGQDYIFGGGVGNTQYSCGTPLSLPASGTNLEDLIEYPRTGDLGDQTLGTWLRQSSRTYFVQTRIKAAGGTLGDPALLIEVRRRRVDNVGTGNCGNNPPTTTDFDQDTGWLTLTYSFVTDALLRVPVSDVTASNTCSGLDPNDDNPVGNNQDDWTVTSASPDVTVNLKYPTVANPSFLTNRRFDEGDLLPLNWTKNNKDEILRRLAPNLRLGETVPDFRVARYFQDVPVGDLSDDDHALRLRNNSVRPLLAEGNTPLGNSIQSFRTWYAGCAQGTCPKNTGWKDVAAANDPNWPCRKKYLLVLTDGDETCSNGNGACSGTASLRAQEGITTFVIAFGLPGGSNVLTCMAANGGSGTPVFPNDKQALINALRDIFGAIKEQARTFASAAVPGVQAEVQDKIYLTNFTPLNNNAYWDGHVDAYLKPLPLTAQGFPDKSRACSSGLVSQCHAWDASVKILDLAPTDAELAGASPNFRIGGANNQRRVLYTQNQAPGPVPLSRKLLLPQSTQADKTDLYLGLGVTVPNFSVPAEVNAADTEVRDILKSTFKKKQDVVNTATGTTNITYLLGDIFHSNPIVLSAPSRALYFAADLYTENKDCPDGDPGYRCFAAKHELRRKMLIVGSNDQQLHVFDAGIFRGSAATGKFDDGTGYEILSYVPRPVLPNLKVLKNDTTQHWGVDGTIRTDDVFIDPSHNGTPTTTEREWRTVVLGGLREGGSGYFAVDLTQPDTLASEDVPQPSSLWVPSCWNGGAGCGTVPFGSVLWNFVDTSDKDVNGHPDLGDAWSVPNTGRILVKTTDSPPVFQDKFVAVFGGGMDPNKLNQRGNWLYMVDIETGKAIYKRPLEGSAPSDPAAVDTDQDGYLDTVYIGTTAGYLYKAKIGAAGTFERNASTGNEWQITDPAWEPFKVFDTLQSDTGKRGQIFFQPSVLFVTELGKYALAFGIGNREDLWAKDLTPGRFYMILDDNFQLGMTPRNETQYTNITVFSTAPTDSNFLLKPPAGFQAGWYLKLDTDERMITTPFALSGITIFTSYDPRTDVTTPGVCAQSGESNIFTVYSTTGDAVDTTLNARFERRSDFVTSPFVELSVTKNQLNSGGSGGNTSPDLCAEKSAVTEHLKTMLFGGMNCQFTAYTQNIETIQSAGGLVCIAPVPICVVRKNWKED